MLHAFWPDMEGDTKSRTVGMALENIIQTLAVDTSLSQVHALLSNIARFSGAEKLISITDITLENTALSKLLSENSELKDLLQIMNIEQRLKEAGIDAKGPLSPEKKEAVTTILKDFFSEHKKRIDASTLSFEAKQAHFSSVLEATLLTFLQKGYLDGSKELGENGEDIRTKDEVFEGYTDVFAEATKDMQDLLNDEAHTYFEKPAQLQLLFNEHADELEKIATISQRQEGAGADSRERSLLGIAGGGIFPVIMLIGFLKSGFGYLDSPAFYVAAAGLAGSVYGVAPEIFHSETEAEKAQKQETTYSLLDNLDEQSTLAQIFMQVPLESLEEGGMASGKANPLFSGLSEALRAGALSLSSVQWNAAVDSFDGVSDSQKAEIKQQYTSLDEHDKRRLMTLLHKCQRMNIDPRTVFPKESLEDVQSA